MSVAPPRPKGPPLNALRAFEAAARLGGFVPAAEELGVTPGAVAQQIKALEAWAGARLFRRQPQGVTLSPLGSQVQAQFSAAFDQLGEATQLLRTAAAPAKLRIATLPSIAQLWLAPRLARIRERVPSVEVSITAMEKPPNLKREPFDLSIFVHDAPPSRDAIALCDDETFPVCAPHLAARLREPADLAGERLLHDAVWSHDWGDWLQAADCNDVAETTGPMFSLYSLAVEEARNGAGVLIGHAPLVAGLIADGHLVEPFRLRLKRGRSFYLTPPHASARSLLLGAVIDTLREAAT